MPAWDSRQLASIYQRLNEGEVSYVVVGGQAANLWGEHYHAASRYPDSVWDGLLPFASMDLDLFGGRSDADQAGRTLGVRAYIYDPFAKVDTPNAGTLYVPLATGDDEPSTQELLIHYLHRLRGLNSDDIPSNAWPLDWYGQRVLVLHPVLCLEAKLANLSSLPQEGRQDLKHARICALAVRAFLEDRLVDDHPREVTNLIERLMRLASRDDGLLAWHGHGLDLREAVPLGALRAQAATAPKVENFLSLRWPQLEVILADRRQRFVDGVRVHGVEPHPPAPLLPAETDLAAGDLEG